MPKRNLRLVKESLTPLETDALGSVVGGWISIPHQQCLPYTFQIDCINDLSFEVCPTPTIPIEHCL